MVLKQLFQELETADISTCVGPTDDLAPDDVILGYMPDEAKQVYVLITQVEQAAQEHIQQWRALVDQGQSTPNDPEQVHKATLLRDRYEALSKLLWVAIDAAIGPVPLEKQRDSLALRTGWAVVSCVDHTPNPFEGMMELMPGMFMGFMGPGSDLMQ